MATVLENSTDQLDDPQNDIIDTSADTPKTDKAPDLTREERTVVNTIQSYGSSPPISERFSPFGRFRGPH
ncbi:MAG: hypothetical protein R3C05_24215 [Pirellulaceae bacterium]